MKHVDNWQKISNTKKPTLYSIYMYDTVMYLYIEIELTYMTV